MLSRYRGALSFATWTGLTFDKAGPVLNEVKNNLSVHKGAHAYVVPKSEAGAPTATANKAVDICMFLQTNGIKASITTKEDTNEKVILFKEYSSLNKDSKEQLVGLLSAVENKVQNALVTSGCSLKKNPSNVF
jgi:hypothetical protein